MELTKTKEMEIIQNRNETIGIDQLTEKHIVVGFVEKKPVILTSDGYEGASRLAIINAKISIGNGYNMWPNKDTGMKVLLKYWMSEGAKFEAFHQDKWKDALKWLIENAE